MVNKRTISSIVAIIAQTLGVTRRIEESVHNDAVMQKTKKLQALKILVILFLVLIADLLATSC